MRLLITGFAPFGGERVNPSWQAVRAMDDFSGHEMAQLELPVAYGRAADLLLQAFELHTPDAVLMVGQGGGSGCVKIERLAVNLNDSINPDADGVTRTDALIHKDGPVAYFSTLPVREMMQAVQGSGIPAQLSTSAGTYVCNDLFYRVCHYVALRSLQTRVGFVHVPFLPVQVASRPAQPSMGLSDTVSALEAIVSMLMQG